jgi:hypothetical protein
MFSTVDAEILTVLLYDSDLFCWPCTGFSITLLRNMLEMDLHVAICPSNSTGNGGEQV